MEKLKKIAKNIWKYILYLFDSIFRLFIKIPAANPCENERKKLLLIRVDGIGDGILWLDSLKGLTNIYPPDTYRYTFVCNKSAYPLFKSFDYFYKVITLDKNKFYGKLAYRFNILKSICSMEYDIIIQPTYSREFSVGDSIVRLAKAPVKAGSSGDRSNITGVQKKISDKWYTKLIPASKSVLMELERNAEFIRGLGYEEFLPSVPVLTKRTPQLELPGKPYFVIFPGSITVRKMWPSERFSEIARRVYRKNGWLTVICGSNSERAICERIYLSLSDDMPVMNLAGKTTIEDLCEVIREAKLLISNDTGSIHIAASVSTASVCILGGGHMGRFLPYSIGGRALENAPVCVMHRMNCFNCSWQCIHRIRENEPFPCIQNVSLDAVWESVSGLI
jgi:ADP-heptose:LPS heptosyltransferase